MFSYITCSQERRQIAKWAFSLATLCVVLFFATYSGNTEESENNSLPSSPDTGSPEEDFSAGGTRDNHRLTKICGENGQKIAYLLGNNNREFTLSAYPTFWFYIPDKFKNVAEIEFTVTELETGKKVYNRALQMPEKAGMMGISIPQQQNYALYPKVNYSWSLQIHCAESNNESVMTLEGWIQRISSNADLENQLATVSREDQYKIYLQQDLLYDALNHLVQLRIAQPDNTQLKTAWNQLLVELGWQDLARQSPVNPYLWDTNTTYAETR